MYDKQSDDLLKKIVEKVVFKEGLSWRDRRRIVKLRVLAEALEKCCEEGCSSTLDLRNTESEKSYGFASLLWVRCVECGALNSIKTSTSHNVKKKSTSVQCKHKGSRRYDTFRIIRVQKKSKV